MQRNIGAGDFKGVLPPEPDLTDGSPSGRRNPGHRHPDIAGCGGKVQHLELRPGRIAGIVHQGFPREAVSGALNHILPDIAFLFKQDLPAQQIGGLPQIDHPPIAGIPVVRHPHG